MLPRAARLTERESFRRATRTGRRAATSLLVLHALIPSAGEGQGPAQVGFVVGRSAGNAVTRNRVRRRLRHLMATRWAELPDGSLLVVRALPGAAEASSAELASALDQALGRLGSGDRPRVGSGERSS